MDFASPSTSRRSFSLGLVIIGLLALLLACGRKEREVDVAAPQLPPSDSTAQWVVEVKPPVDTAEAAAEVAVAVAAAETAASAPHDERSASGSQSGATNNP